MNKEQFLAAIRAQINCLPREDVEKSLDYYREMLDDRMEDGLTEEEAVAAMGPVDEIAAQILLDTPLPRLVRATVTPDRALRAWEIVLLAVGSPVWVPLALAALCVFGAVYLVLWSLVACLYAVDLSFAAGGVGGVVSSVFLVCTGFPVQALLFLGAGLLCAGLAIALFLGSNRAAAGAARLGKAIVLWVKSLFVGRRK